MVENTELKELEAARDKLIDKIVDTQIGSDIDKLMPLLNAVDDFRTAFDVETDINN